MQRTTGAVVGVILLTSGLGIWLALRAADSGSINWLGALLLWLWGIIIFSAIGASVERITDVYIGFYNGALVALLLVAFATVPQLFVAVYDFETTSGDPFRIANLTGPRPETLLQWAVAVAAFVIALAVLGAIVGWLVEKFSGRNFGRKPARLG